MTREDFGIEAQGQFSHTKTIKQMAEEERPRERAMLYGIGSLTTAELLAVILRTGQQGMPITDLCRQMLEDNDNSLLKLERRTRKELMLTKGIGAAKALQIEAMMEIMRRYLREATDAATKVIDQISSSKMIYERMRCHIANLSHEEIWIILLNRRNQVLKEFRATSGGQNASVFDVRMVMKRALLEEACGLIMCHNHPSGNLKPSPQDDNITRTLQNAGKALDINVLDHVIVTVGGYYSYNDEGRM